MVNQPTREVEAKCVRIFSKYKLFVLISFVRLSQMILDRIFRGILDQGAGCLIVYDEPEDDKTYESTLETLKTVGQVVDVSHF